MQIEARAIYLFDSLGGPLFEARDVQSFRLLDIYEDCWEGETFRRIFKVVVWKRGILFPQ